jgi:TetR/AcrR family transcriptional regulator, mexJK operon transcriptional repressor
MPLDTQKTKLRRPSDSKSVARGGRSAASPKCRQILDSARALFLDQGFDTTSMDAVAERAGVSKATLYVYFDDKDALLLALVEDECGRFGPTPLWQSRGKRMDLTNDLRAIAQAFLNIFLDHRGLAMQRLIMACASRYPKVAETFMQAGPNRCYAEVAEFLRAARAQRLVDIPDIELAATQFISLVQGKLPVKWAMSMQAPSEAERQALIEGGIRVFLAAYQRNEKAKPNPRRSRSESADARNH